MINGNEYAWEDLQVVVEGNAFPLNGVINIRYKATKVHVNIKGRGNKPVSMGRGPEDYEGSLTILQSELEAMQDTLGMDSLVTRKPFQISVSYAPLVGPKRTDLLMGCRILEVERALGTEDTHMEVELPLAIFRIVRK